MGACALVYLMGFGELDEVARVGQVWSPLLEATHQEMRGRRSRRTWIEADEAPYFSVPQRFRSFAPERWLSLLASQPQTSIQYQGRSTIIKPPRVRQRSRSAKNERVAAPPLLFSSLPSALGAPPPTPCTQRATVDKRGSINPSVPRAVDRRGSFTAPQPPPPLKAERRAAEGKTNTR